MQCNYLIVGEEQRGQSKTFIHPPVKSSTHRIGWSYIPVGYKIISTVSNVCDHLGKLGDKIDKLQITGHGDAGSMFVGEDLNEDTIWPFGWLRSMFVNMAFGIQLLGCGVAADSSIYASKSNWGLGKFNRNSPGKGYRMMRRLAQATGQTVEAGIHVQVNDAFYDIEGDALRVYPDGSTERFVGASNA